MTHDRGARLVGRDGEHSAVRAAVQGALYDRPRVVVIDGPAGGGRSALALVAAEAAEAAGFAVAATRAAPDDRTAPMRIAQAVAAALGGPGCDAERLRSLADAAVFLCVDDAHWADEASLRALLQLARGSRARPLVLLLTAVPGRAVGPTAAVLDDARALPESTLIAVRPLGHEDAAALAGAILDEAPQRVVDLCVWRSAGLPALLVALAEDLRDRVDSLDAAATHVPDRVRAAVAARVARLGADAVGLARAVHVLGEDAPLRHAAALADLDAARAAHAADALVRDGVLQDTPAPAFSAPLLGSAVGAGLTKFALAQEHRRAAALLAAEGRPDREVAAHLLQATPAGESWAARPLLAEARRQAAAGRLREAASTLSRAFDERPGPDELAGVSEALAVVRTRLGEADAAGQLAAALAAASTAEARAPLLREITRRLWLDGRMAEALRVCERAMDEAGPGTAAHADPAAELLAIAAGHDVQAITENPALATLLERARQGWVPEAPGLAVALAFVLPLVLADHGLVLPLVDRAIDHELWDPGAAPFGLRANFAITTLHWADELQRASDLLAEGADAVDEDPARHSAMAHWDAESQLATGDLAGACAAGQRALEAVGEEAPWWLPFTAATVAHAQLDRGDGVAADAALRVAEGSFDPTQLSGLGAKLARSRWHLHHGDAAAARKLARDVGAGAAALGHRDGPAVVWRPVAAAADRAAGEDGQAEALAEEEVALARGASARGRLGQALRVAASTGPSDAALERLEEAVGVLATTGRRLELARALAALGEERHRRGDVAGARDAAAEARQLAEHCEAAPLAGRALACLHATGARPRRTDQHGPGALTAAERRVVELAARGLSNQAIGKELVVTPRTVEWHLGRAYRKLRVSSRRELRSALGATTD